MHIHGYVHHTDVYLHTRRVAYVRAHPVLLSPFRAHALTWGTSDIHLSVVYIMAFAPANTKQLLVPHATWHGDRDTGAEKR